MRLKRIDSLSRLKREALACWTELRELTSKVHQGYPRSALLTRLICMKYPLSEVRDIFALLIQADCTGSRLWDAYEQQGKDLQKFIDSFSIAYRDTDFETLMCKVHQGHSGTDGICFDIFLEYPKEREEISEFLVQNNLVSSKLWDAYLKQGANLPRFLESLGF